MLKLQERSFGIPAHNMHLPLSSPSSAVNSIVPFKRPSLSINKTPNPKLPAPVVKSAAATAAVGSVGGASAKVGLGKLALGFAGKFLGVVAFSLAVQTVERMIAPLWFDWLEKFTGFRFRGKPERIPTFPPGRYGIKATGYFIGVIWSWLKNPHRDEPDTTLTYTVNPYNETKEVVFNEPVKLAYYTPSYYYFPLSGNVIGWVGGGNSHIALVFSNDQKVWFRFTPQIDPGQLGPFYKTVWFKPTFNISIEIVSSTEPRIPPGTVVEYKPVTINQITNKKVEQFNQTKNTVNIIAPPILIPNVPITVSPKILPPTKTPFPQIKISPKIEIKIRPTAVPKRAPEYLESPEVSPELEPIREILERILDKECPDPCPPCHGEKEPEPDDEDEGSGGDEGGEGEPIPEVLLFWVDRQIDSQGAEQFYLQQGTFRASIPSAILQKIERTAKDFWKVASSNPIVAASAQDESPWKQPIGDHLKVIWTPETGKKGYYSLRVPHWILSRTQTLSLNWSSLRWEKGFRNELQVRFSTGKSMVLYGHDLNNLEQIFNFCLQGVQTGIGFEIKKVLNDISTSRKTLVVKKLEFWTTRAGHPQWWSWWPPL